MCNSPLKLTALVIAASVQLLPASAEAQSSWMLNLEAPGAFPLSSQQRSWFEPGVMPSAALFLTGRGRAVGVRARGGILRDGEASSDPGLTNYGTGGLAALSAVFRFGSTRHGARGPWLEAAAGGAITGRRKLPVFEVGVGWSLHTGSFAFGPSARYLILRSSNPAMEPSAELVLFGLEVSFGRTHRKKVNMRAARLAARILASAPPRPAAAPAPVDRDSDEDGIKDSKDKCPNEAEDVDKFEDTDGCPDPDNDGDRILDVDDQCPDHAEVVNGIDDKDGCPDKGVVEVKEDRIVLGARVLFDFKKARVKRRGKKVLRAVVKLIEQHPEWSHIRIEGHSCVRGRERGNWLLSRVRAKNVRRALVRMGIARDRLSTAGLGSTKPRHTGRSERELRSNRRVELVIIKKRTITRAVRTHTPPATRTRP